jgi:transcriptional regulator with XRE-family HTH domain
MESGKRPPLATALQSAMDAKGWGPEETARQAEIEPRTVYRYLSPKPPRAPHRSVLSKLARALGTPELVDFSVRQSPTDLEERLASLEERVDLLLEHLDGDQPTPA